MTINMRVPGKTIRNKEMVKSSFPIRISTLDHSTKMPGQVKDCMNISMGHPSLENGKMVTVSKVYICILMAVCVMELGLRLEKMDKVAI